MSAHTAIVSPLHTPRSCPSLAHNGARTTVPTPPEPVDLVHGEVAPTQADEATPGYSPEDAPAPCDADAPALCDARPPRSSPPERLSWLYVPPFDAAAGILSEEIGAGLELAPVLGRALGRSCLSDAPCASGGPAGRRPLAQCSDGSGGP